MAITETTFVSQVTLLPQSKAVNVQWTTQIEKEGLVIAKTYKRTSYSETESARFAAEVENAAVYIQALGWTLDG